MKLETITPVLLTFNEEANIGRTLEKLRWARTIVILDSGSTDQTESLCRAFPQVHWHQRRFDLHSLQWNAALSLADSPWVMTLDADYILSRELMDEILSLPEEPGIEGYKIPFIYQIHGQSLRQSLLPPRIALFRKSSGHYVHDGHTQDLFLQGSCRRLNNPIYHDDRKPFHRWWASQEKYADLEVDKLRARPWRQLKMQDKLRKLIFPAPFAVLFFTLIIRKSFLDGKAGWVYTGQRFLAEALLSLKLATAWFKA